MCTFKANYCSNSLESFCRKTLLHCRCTWYQCVALARHGDASTRPDVAALKIALNAEYGRGVVQGDVLPWRPSSY